ncbi:hypothetical protein B0615_003424, partial [Salmonella enterica]|nr:hypothetical protein [Salmonella enterica]EDR9538186.1 hypothetical protein [Salmonella enterica]EDS9537794.1 hypothetical protein [Salmonella enterica]EDU4501033.1 hypothetical protein [Salmonella enterica]EDY0983204.1 hypothetical protein [Salmonella enterica]
HIYDLFHFTFCGKRHQYIERQAFYYRFCEAALSFFNLNFLAKKSS